MPRDDGCLFDFEHHSPRIFFGDFVLVLADKRQVVANTVAVGVTGSQKSLQTVLTTPLCRCRIANRQPISDNKCWSEIQ